MDKGLATNNDIDAMRNNMRNGLILKNVKFMDRLARLSNNAIRLPNYDRSVVEHSVANDPNQAHHKKSLKIFHQNIRGLRTKHNELLCHLSHDCPYILCLSEHHLNKDELQLIHFTDYLLGTKYCRKTFLKGGVCIFVAKNLIYKTINLDKYNIDKDIETCVFQLDSSYNKVCILTIYRSPEGNFKNFLKQLDLILHKIYNHRYNIIICGDVNYLSDNRDKNQLNMVLHSYNLSSIVKFPTRFELNSCTTIDISSLGNYELYPLTNGLSDHEAQLLVTHKIHKQAKEDHTYFKKKINRYNVADFRLNLSHESWGMVFYENDVNKAFNIF
jgi:exonuclease III